MKRFANHGDPVRPFVNRRALPRTCVVAGGLVLAMTLAACSSSSRGTSGGSAGASGGGTIKIGFIMPESGAYASYGTPVKPVIKMVTDEINNHGGINGSKIQIITLDSPNDPVRATTDMRQLASDGVVGFVGPFFTGETQSAAALSAKVKVPMLAVAGTPEMVAVSPYSYRVNITYSQGVNAAIDEYTRIYPWVKNVVIVGDNQQAITSNAIKNYWPVYLPKHGLKIDQTITFASDTTDFSAIVTRIKATAADGIVMDALNPAASHLVQELHDQGVKLPILSDNTLNSSPIFPKLVGAPANGIVYPNPFDPTRLNMSIVQKYIDSYQSVAGTHYTDPADFPLWSIAPIIYDAFHVLLHVVRTAGISGSTAISSARSKVIAGLATVHNFPGVAGNLSVGAEHNISWNAGIVIAEDGEWKSAMDAPVATK